MGRERASLRILLQNLSYFFFRLYFLQWIGLIGCSKNRQTCQLYIEMSRLVRLYAGNFLKPEAAGDNLSTLSLAITDCHFFLYSSSKLLAFNCIKNALTILKDLGIINPDKTNSYTVRSRNSNSLVLTSLDQFKEELFYGLQSFPPKHLCR